MSTLHHQKSAQNPQMRCTDIFPFEKLPAELRITIYGDVFGTIDTVRIHRRRPAKGTASVLKGTVEVLRKNQITTKIVPFQPKQGVAILRINKLAYQEALPILYSARTFCFTSIPSLQQFAVEARAGLPLVQHIKLMQWGEASLGQALAKLKPATGLQRFEIDVPSCSCLDAAFSAHFLQRGVTAFIRLGETPAAARHRFDIVSFNFRVIPHHIRRGCETMSSARCAQKSLEIKALLEKTVLIDGNCIEMPPKRQLPVTKPKTPLKARSRAVKKGNGGGVFELEWLPPELRNEIYRHALSTNRTIVITHHKGSKGRFGAKGRILKSTAMQKRKIAFGKELTPALLRVSRTVYAEAMQLLYAENCFRFNSTATFKVFVQELGEKASLLTDIELDVEGGSQTPEYLARALKGLQRMKNLARLELQFYTYAYSSVDLQSLAGRLWAGVGGFVTGAAQERASTADRDLEGEEKMRLDRVSYKIVDQWQRLLGDRATLEERQNVIKAEMYEMWQETVKARRSEGRGMLVVESEKAGSSAH